MDILEIVAIEIPCSTCGGRYEVTLKQIALSQQMLHEGCPVRVETECPPLSFSGLVDQELIQDLQKIWLRLEKKARGASGELKLHSAIMPACADGSESVRRDRWRRWRWSKMSSQQAQSKREMPIAEVVRLIDLVNYQEGSVVSRTLVNRATGTVTLFAFDEGQGLSEHTAPFDAVAHLLEGEAEIAVSGKPLRTTAGEAVLMPANQPHSLKALSRFKMLLTMIRS